MACTAGSRQLILCLVRPTARVRAFAAIVVVLVCAACSYHGDAHVYGVPFLVSRADLRAATVALRRSDHLVPIHAYRVNSRDNIWIYQSEDLDGTYTELQRIDGDWQVGDRMLVIKRPL